jgi:hypothetical protein
MPAAVNAYKTNPYKVPIGVFVWVNNHPQSTSFACTLVTNESEESIVWLFQTWGAIW